MGKEVWYQIIVYVESGKKWTEGRSHGCFRISVENTWKRLRVVCCMTWWECHLAENVRWLSEAEKWALKLLGLLKSKSSPWWCCWEWKINQVSLLGKGDKQFSLKIYMHIRCLLVHLSSFVKDCKLHLSEESLWWPLNALRFQEKFGCMDWFHEGGLSGAEWLGLAHFQAVLLDCTSQRVLFWADFSFNAYMKRNTALVFTW